MPHYSVFVACIRSRWPQNKMFSVVKSVLWIRHDTIYISVPRKRYRITSPCY